MGRERVGFALVVRIYREGLKGGEGMWKRFDGVESGVRRFIEKGGWEEESGVRIFVCVPVEVHGFLVVCSDCSLAVPRIGV